MVKFECDDFLLTPQYVLTGRIHLNTANTKLFQKLSFHAVSRAKTILKIFNFLCAYMTYKEGYFFEISRYVQLKSYKKVKIVLQYSYHAIAIFN